MLRINGLFHLLIYKWRINWGWTNPLILTSWWFQPIWKILVKLDHFPSRGKIKHIWNHHLANLWSDHFRTPGKHPSCNPAGLMPRNNDAKTSTMVVTLDGYVSAWVKFLSPPRLFYPKKRQVSKHFLGGSLITVPTVRLFFGDGDVFFLEICCKPFIFRASIISMGRYLHFSVPDLILLRYVTGHLRTSNLPKKTKSSH